MILKQATAKFGIKDTCFYKERFGEVRNMQDKYRYECIFDLFKGPTLGLLLFLMHRFLKKSFKGW